MIFGGPSGSSTVSSVVCCVVNEAVITRLDVGRRLDPSNVFFLSSVKLCRPEGTRLNGVGATCDDVSRIVVDETSPRRGRPTCLVVVCWLRGDS